MIYRILLWAPAALFISFLVDGLCFCWKPFKASQVLFCLLVVGAFFFAANLIVATLGGWSLDSSLPAAIFGEPWDTLIGIPFRSFFDVTASMPGEEAGEDFLGSRWTALIVLCGLANLSIGWVIYRFSRRRASWFYSKGGANLSR